MEEHGEKRWIDAGDRPEARSLVVVLLLHDGPPSTRCCCSSLTRLAASSSTNSQVPLSPYLSLFVWIALFLQ
jgi:hypothetical protein